LGGLKVGNQVILGMLIIISLGGGVISSKNIIVHEVKKNNTESEFKLHPRDSENPIDNHSKKLVKELTDLFRKTGMSTGSFITPETEDDPKPHFVKVLENHFDGSSFDDFVAFSKAATKEFIKKLNASSSSKGGYLWFNHYIYNNDHFLSIVLLRKKHGLALNDLTLDEIERLDLDKLHMAARINLSTWKNGSSSKYIAFKVGRDAKGVTDYFSLFIGCEEQTQSRVDTANLIEATKQYCIGHNLSAEKTETVKQFVYDQCVSWKDEEQPVLLDNLSTLLDTSFAIDKPDEHGKFLEISQSAPFLLNNEIIIHKDALKGLTRYKGNNTKMRLSFDSELLGETVIYDKSTGYLEFRDIPSNLKAELNK